MTDRTPSEKKPVNWFITMTDEPQMPEAERDELLRANDFNKISAAAAYEAMAVLRAENEALTAAIQKVKDCCGLSDCCRGDIDALAALKAKQQEKKP